MTEIVAELSGNHNGSLDRALKIMEEVAAAGVKYFKIQTYTADTLTLPLSTGNFLVSDNHPLWGSQSLYQLYEKAYTPWEWHKPIFEKARNLGLISFSTPFDESAVDFLESLDVPLYKIASLEIIDIPLIKKVASTRKPVILSTGTATISEIDEAVSALKLNGCPDITLLVCSSSYPADFADLNLSRMRVLKDLFDVKVGFSDHTIGITAAIVASALGADIIEKHVTDDVNSGIDSKFSLETIQLSNLVDSVKAAAQSIGSPSKWALENESESIKHRPSIYATKKISKGDFFTKENIATLRPSGGLHPRFYEDILDKKAQEDIEFGTPLKWRHVE